MDAPRTRAGRRDASSPRQARPPLSSWLLGILRRPRRNPFRRNRVEGRPLGDVRAAEVYPGASADERGEGPLILSECSGTQENPLDLVKADRGGSSPGSAASRSAPFSTRLDAFPQEIVEELSETEDRSKAGALVVPLLPLFVVAASTFSPPTDRHAEGEEVADPHNASNDETPRTDTSSCEGSGGRHLPLAVPDKSPTSLPEEAPLQNASFAQASEGPLISRLAQHLLCCSCMKSYTQERGPQPDLELGREGASRQEAVEPRGDTAHAEPLVYGEFVFSRPSGGHQARPCQVAAKERGVALNPILRTRRSLLPQPTDASISPPPSEQRRKLQTSESSQKSLNEGPLELGQGDPPEPEGSAYCPWVLLSCFSLKGRGKAPLSLWPSGRATPSLSSSWAHSPRLEAWDRHRATGVAWAPRAKCLRRLRDEQRQTWMEYQEIIMEDNSKRRQWVDVGDEGGQDGEAGRLTLNMLN
ncbi:hypothetical protein Emag_006195 [Eimeria magna]